MTLSLEELKSKAEQAIELASKATEGPWHVEGRDGVLKHIYAQKMRVDDGQSYSKFIASVCVKKPFDNQKKLNGEFIAAARTLLPDLAEGVLELIKGNESLKIYLEETESDFKEYNKKIHRLKEKLKIAEEALEYYTKPVRYMNTFDPETEEPCMAVMATHYNKAHVALKKIRGEADES